MNLLSGHFENFQPLWLNKLYNALKGQGIETEYVKYNDEGHNFEQPANRRDSLERSIRWIDNHIGIK